MLRGVFDFEGFNIRKYHRNVQRFFLFGAAYFSGMALFFLLYNLYLLRLGYREDFIGRLAGMMPLASGLFAFLIGILSDRIGRKPFLIAAALFLGLSQLGLCLFLDPFLLLCSSFVGGVSTALIFVNHVPFLAENCAPERRGEAISIGFSIQVVTRTLVSLGGGALPGAMAVLWGIPTDRPEPFRYVLLLGAGVTLLSVLPLLGLRPSGRREVDAAPGRESEEAPGTPWRMLTIFTTISAFRGLAFGICMPFFNVFFQEEFHASAAAIGAIFFCSQGVGLPSAMAAPALSRRFGVTVAIVPLRLLGALCLGMVGCLHSLFLGVLVFLVFSVAENISVPMEMTFSADTVSRAYWGRIQSLRVTGFQLFAAAGSIWAGEMILRIGYASTFGMGALALLASVAPFLIGFGWHPRR